MKSRLLRNGFTLIELLVVITIISLLIAIALPALGKAREAAKKTMCLTHVREMFTATLGYVGEQGRLPDLNNDPDEGTLQYNYLIYDGEDYEQCFGPLAKPNGVLADPRVLFCPLQRDPYHMYKTDVNPWPPARNSDTRASYSRRYGLSGKSFSDFRQVICYAADAVHLPDLVQSGHKKGVNAVYTDGHAQWVPDPGMLADNELTKPFDRNDNPLMEDIWHALDRAGR